MHRSAIEANGNNLYGVRTFRELHQNVAIDFSFDPETLEITIDDAQDDGGLRVVVGNDGALHGATRDPNATIYQYLERKRHENK